MNELPRRRIYNPILVCFFVRARPPRQGLSHSSFRGRLLLFQFRGLRQPVDDGLGLYLKGLRLTTKPGLAGGDRLLNLGTMSCLLEGVERKHCKC